MSHSGRSKAYSGFQTGRGKMVARGDVDRGSKSRSSDRHDKQAWDKGDHDKNWHGRHHRHGHFAGNVFIYSNDWGYGENCAWLRRQALTTGSPYWWSRYNACISVY